MSLHLQRDLIQLQRDLVALASLVEETLLKATQALRRHDSNLAQQVIIADLQIDQEEIQIDEECLKILALHQPVAIDLRRIVSTMMVNSDLERIGDLAEEIAERSLHLSSLPVLQIPPSLEAMSELVISMVRTSLDSFVNRDARLARQVLGQDEEVDRYNNQIIQSLIEIMKASPDLVPVSLSLFSAVRHLERIGDHATNIAEDVVFLVEGEVLRHRMEARKGTRG